MLGPVLDFMILVLAGWVIFFAAPRTIWVDLASGFLDWAYGWDPHGPSDTARLGGRAEGYFPDEPAKTCLACDGKGAIQENFLRQDALGIHRISVNITCPVCIGHGNLLPSDDGYVDWTAPSPPSPEG